MVAQRGLLQLQIVTQLRQVILAVFLIIKLKSASGTTMKVTAFKNQGFVLVDNSGTNSFHLDFADNSSATLRLVRTQVATTTRGLLIT
jgi:hypothetical protein